MFIGTNKAQYVINTILVETVRVHRFLSAIILFLIVEHTKTEADQMLADVTHVSANKDIFNH